MILIVDDEPFNVDVLSEELEDLGHQTMSAQNGRQALRLLDEYSFDVVFLDIMMPQMDGFGVLAELQGRQRLASLPVIVISAIDDVASVARCLQLGAEDFLLKPFDPTLLRARLNGALEKKALRDQVVGQLATARSVFGKFVPESVASKILAGEGVLPASESIATILYCDIQNFTSIAEPMAPSQVLDMLNDYFAAVLEPVSENGGTVNQFLGDAMLVTFNVPVADALHADKALNSAIEIQEVIARRRFGGKQLRTRIGINTGPIIAGNIDTGDRLHYTVLGDTVNVAARLEALNKSHGTNLLISGTTVAMLNSDYSLERISDVSIRGKQQPVSIYRRRSTASLATAG